MFKIGDKVKWNVNKFGPYHCIASKTFTITDVVTSKSNSYTKIVFNDSCLFYEGKKLPGKSILFEKDENPHDYLILESNSLKTKVPYKVACIDCKFHKDHLCRCPSLESKKFNPIYGYSYQSSFCYVQNKDGQCKFFEKHLLAKICDWLFEKDET